MMENLLKLMTSFPRYACWAFFVFINSQNGSSKCNIQEGSYRENVARGQNEGRDISCEIIGKRRSQRNKIPPKHLEKYSESESDSGVNWERIKSKTGEEFKWKLDRESERSPGKLPITSLKHPCLMLSKWDMWHMSMAAI